MSKQRVCKWCGRTELAFELWPGDGMCYYSPYLLKFHKFEGGVDEVFTANKAAELQLHAY